MDSKITHIMDPLSYKNFYIYYHIYSCKQNKTNPMGYMKLKFSFYRLEKEVNCLSQDHKFSQDLQLMFT